MNKLQTIRVGIAGLGRSGKLMHYAALKNNPAYKIAAVADPDDTRTREIAEETGCLSFNSVEAMAESGACDLIVVATPSSAHFEDASTVLGSGISCIVEKPMAASFEEAQSLVRLAEERGVHLFVHHQHLFYDEYNHFKEVLDSGVLGELFQIRAFWGGFSRRSDWQTLKKNGGGQLNNTCPHALSVVLPLLGEPVAFAYADLRNVKDAGDAEDHVQIFLETESGKTADITVTGACAYPLPRWMLLGSTGTLVSDGENSSVKSFDPRKVASLEVRDFAPALVGAPAEQLPWTETVRPTRPEGLPGAFHENVAQVMLNRAAPVVSACDALEVMRVLEMCRNAAENKRAHFSVLS